MDEEFVTDPQERPGTGGLTLPPARLTFACELDRARLAELFADPPVIEDLPALDARVALMCSDFGDERAGVVRRLLADAQSGCSGGRGRGSIGFGHD